ncbi:ABC transporter permease [Microbacterium sp. NPDC076768]|uniref:ABC transporter permease n=1 Tax=Microbacterium sp. NPDC076768 TaxID=3154858 RepID=UPI003434F4C6
MATATPAVVPAASSARGADGILSGRWVRFGIRRAGRLLVSLWVLITASFLMIPLIPGDPVRAALGPTAPPDVVEARRQALGLNDPLFVQYWNYLQGLMTGDLGTSMVSSLPVAETIWQRLPATLQLAGLAFVVAILVAVPLGVTMAILTRRGKGRKTELVFTSSSVVVSSIPDFLLGVILVAVFAVSLGWLPVAGRSGADSFVLPVIALAAGSAAVLSRIVRVEMIGVLDADYIRTARSKRLASWVVNLRHALPNAVTASLTIGGMLLGGLVASTVLVENVFAWPGLGSVMVSSITTKDYPLIQATVLVYGVGVLLANTLVDIVLALLDPRSTIGEN